MKDNLIFYIAAGIALFIILSLFFAQKVGGSPHWAAPAVCHFGALREVPSVRVESCLKALQNL